MIEAVVFDMDGLMIDSQPFWQTAQLEILPQLGVPITQQDTIATTGMRIDHIVQLCYAESPWDSVTCDEVCERILKRVTELVQEHKPAMPGLSHALELCQQQGWRLALASSSPMTLIDAAIAALRLDGVFIVKSSGDKLRYGKPHPEVYLNACDALSVEPQRCVAIEDSFVGLLAAKAAQMKTIVIPNPSFASHQHFVIADKKLRSLEELTLEIFQSL
ncbi:MAG: hexitol phosphatase HxpB [Planctomycetaceae bacterium]|nr:hexitol phosphatase HxpB [Planctomycetales bacterium]MCB9875484.1 hexitol phosphatase HxpB [Planctomycetaceae bacterium]